MYARKRTLFRLTQKLYTNLSTGSTHYALTAFKKSWLFNDIFGGCGSISIIISPLRPENFYTLKSATLFLCTVSLQYDSAPAHPACDTVEPAPEITFGYSYK